MKRLALLLAALAFAAPAPTRWQIIGPGGGGSLYNPTVSPHDSRIALVSCDMTGAYLTRDGGAHWRIFNLGETVHGFFFDPRNASVIYALGEGLFRTTDTGDSWQRFYPSRAYMSNGDDHGEGTLSAGGQPVPAVTAFAIDPADSRILYLAQGAALLTSSDAGAHWQASMTLPGDARRIWADSKSLYVSGASALYIRTDGKWRTHTFPGPLTGISASPPVFYATLGGKIFVSTDAAATWRESSLPGLHGEATVIAAASGRAETAYVSFDKLRTLTRTTWGVARTTDAGKHWETVYDQVRDAWLTRSLRRRVGRQSHRARRCADTIRTSRTPPIRAASCALPTAASRGTRPTHTPRPTAIGPPQRHRCDHVLRRPLRSVRRAPHVHQLHGYRPVGQRHGGRELVQRDAQRRAEPVGQYDVLGGVRPHGARPHVGRDERHARSAAAQNVAPRFARYVHRRRGALRRWRPHVARAE